MLLISCANDIKFHNCEHYGVVQKYSSSDNSSFQRSISWCRDGSLLALVTTKANAEIIRTKEDVKLLQCITGLNQISAITFQKTTKKNIAVATLTGAVHVYDIKSRSSKKVFKKSGDVVSMLEWNCKDSHLAVLTNSGELSLYNNITNVKSGTVDIRNSKTISTFRFHQDHKNLLSCASDEGAVSIWDYNTSKSKFFLCSHAAPVTDVVFSPQNDTLLTSTSLDRCFNCYDIKQGEVALTVTTSQPLSAIDMAPNGFIVAVGSIRGTVLVYDLRKYNTPLNTVQAHESEIKRVLFQPQDAHFTETVDIQEESIASVPKKNSSVDSFASIINNINEFSPKIDLSEQKIHLSRKRTESFSDSFLSALSPATGKTDNYSIDKLKDMTNLGITESVKKLIDSKNIMDSSNPHCSGLPDLHTDLIGQCRTSSTPRLGINPNILLNEDIQDSPISMFSGNINLEDVQKLITGSIKDTIKETIKDTMRETIQETVNDIVDQKMKEVMDTIHKYYLNLLMSFCRQFVTQESTLKKLLTTDPKDSEMEMLKEENEFLKKKINQFMDKK